jgi:hypothetical protein
MALLASGNLAIGTTTAPYRLTVQADNTDMISWRSPTYEVGRLGLDNTNAHGAIFLYSSGSTLVQISARSGSTTYFNAGNVVIGNTTAYGGLTVSDFTANDGNDAISLFYRGTSGGHQSLMKFYDFRGQLNSSMGNELEDDTPGTPRARMVFKTSNGSSPVERMRISAAGIITAPAQVSFKAYISTNIELSRSTTITVPYNIEEYDTQGNYSTSTYKFTAPVTGKYLFTVNFNAYSLTDAAYLRVMLLINSANVRTLFLIQNMASRNP